MKKEKSELEWRKYWKNKAEKLQKENLMLKQRIMYLELALNIWSEWHSELIVGQNYERQFENSMWEDNWKLTKWGYASFNEYWELMEEDTLQELRDLGKI